MRGGVTMSYEDPLSQRLSFLKKWVPLLADSCEALSFIPLHIVSLVPQALQSVPPRER